MPLRVSLVPPLLEMTTTSVVQSRSLNASKRRSNPSGSVLSKKWIFIVSAEEPSASATNCGPSADPPMPTTSTSVNFLPPGAATPPECTAAAKRPIAAFVSSMALRNSSLGASAGVRSQ